MHVAFIPYGIKKEVDYLIEQMSCQDWQLPVTFYEDGKPVVKYQWIKGHVRLLPFGVIELVFPKEQKDIVFTTLDFNLPNRYGHTGFMFNSILIAIRKALGLKKVGKFDSSKRLLWHRNNINFIPLGYREDIEKTFDIDGVKRTHEAL